MSEETKQCVPPISGGIGISNIRVFNTVGPDGLRGGCPHLHFTCTESYVVTAGKGSVQTLGCQGFAEVPLEPGRLVWFTPGVLHRLINEDGALEIMVVMQNAGLPEAGDHVLCFPFEVLEDPDRYFEIANLSSAAGAVYADNEEASMRRRDLAVEGFNILRARVEKEGAEAMAEFYKRGVELVRPKLSMWKEVWSEKVRHITEDTERHLELLAAADTEHMKNGAVYTVQAPGDERHWGFCGHLGKYDLDGAVCLPGQ